MDFINTPIGSAIVGAIAVVVGVFLFGQLLGWMDDPGVVDYLLGAVAGLVGGFIGGMIRQRRTTT